MINELFMTLSDLSDVNEDKYILQNMEERCTFTYESIDLYTKNQCICLQ